MAKLSLLELHTTLCIQDGGWRDAGFDKINVAKLPNADMHTLQSRRKSTPSGALGSQSEDFTQSDVWAPEVALQSMLRQRRDKTCYIRVTG